MAETTVPPLPEGLASFGAATCDSWIYIYGGHIGKAHDHSRDNLSAHFRRIRLGGGDWQSLPVQTPVQGLALVTHAGRVYRVGGMTAHNASGETADLHSVADFACYVPESKQWTAMPRLPLGRSSHDAVVIGNRLYVVGGWCLSGEDEGKWHDEMLVFDLSKPAASWQAVRQPFRRRALAVTQLDGDLIAIGGMNSDHDVDRSVDFFLTDEQRWIEGPDFPGDGMNGFGVSAWNINGCVIASGSNGCVYRLSDDRSKWLKLTDLAIPRFFHRIVPATDREVLVIGGASMEKGHLTSIERIEFRDEPIPGSEEVVK